MAWSTRELADLAGTTLNTVRHYHRSGLLDEPDRHVNGYKQYGVAHLVRLLQIRRLRDIGVPIAQIERLDAGVGTSPDVLRGIDAALAATIDESLRARADIADILQHGAITEVPSGFARVAPRLSEADRSLTLIYAQLYDPSTMDDVREMLEADTDPATREFDALAEDTDEPTRARLAEQFAITIARAITNYPWMADPSPRLLRSSTLAGATIVETLREIYNPAQLDVLARAGIRARMIAGIDEPGRAARPPDGAPGDAGTAARAWGLPAISSGTGYARGAAGVN